MLPALAEYALCGRDRGRLKSRVIRASLGGAQRTELDAWAETFVHELARSGRFRPGALAVLAAHRARGDHLVLLSASPDLYVPRIGRMLGFERCGVHGDQVARRPAGGALQSANRRGEEKVRCLEELRTQYPGMPIAAYGNSGWIWPICAGRTAPCWSMRAPARGAAPAAPASASRTGLNRFCNENASAPVLLFNRANPRAGRPPRSRS